MRKITLITFLVLTLLLAACNSKTATSMAEPTQVSPTETPAEPEVEEVAPTAETVTVSMDDLTGTTWQWVAFTDPTQQFEVENPASYTLTFQEDGTVAVVADCNNAMGSYTIDGNSLTIEMGPMTLAACPPESRSDDFVKYLGASAIYFFENGNMFIDMMADGGTMEFAPGVVEGMQMDESVTTISLISHTWELGAYVSRNEATVVDDPENYTLTFNADGTVAIKADCNNAIGSYTDDGSSISIEIGPMTMAACESESFSEEFITALGSLGNYGIAQGYLFIALQDSSGILNFTIQNIISEEFSPDADPIFGTLSMGSENNLYIDPLLVSVNSGLVEGYGVDATTLGPGCSGTIPSRPDVVFDWQEQIGIDQLRVFFLSVGDPTMVLVTPSGEVLCNDDFNPLMLDPYIEIKDPQPGRYAAFIGNFEQDMLEPGFLVVTTQDLNPVTMDIAQMLPRNVDPRANNEALSLDVLEIDSDAAVIPPNGSLNPSALVYKQELTGGGEIGAFNIEHENQLCTGFISAAPTFRFDWSGDLEQLVLFFESNVDTTLQILAPDGTYHCDDDFQGSENLNPWVSLAPIVGTYNVWIGSFSPDVLADGVLTISGEAGAVPTSLTSKDIQQ
jgi:heat shock protein HslJ